MDSARAGEAILEPLIVVLEPLPRRLRVLEPLQRRLQMLGLKLGLQEGAARQQLCRVAGCKRDDQSDDCQVDLG